jgi:nicotinamidase-related amidase
MRLAARPLAAMTARAASSAALPVGGAGRLGRLDPATTGLLICDVQEAFRSVISGFDAVCDVSGRAAAAANAFGMPVWVTEQVPSKLGSTAAEVAVRLPRGAAVRAKSAFSMAPPLVGEFAAAPHVISFLLCGVEAHGVRGEREGGVGRPPAERLLGRPDTFASPSPVCVLQTALDLLAAGHDVHLLTDGISSRRLADRDGGLARAAAAGAHLSTSEMAMFELAGGAEHPAFRAISALAKEPRPHLLPGVFGGTGSAKL